jgi:hypothetical protein
MVTLEEQGKRGPPPIFLSGGGTTRLCLRGGGRGVRPLHKLAFRGKLLHNNSLS